MEQTIIVNSFHSQVGETLANILDDAGDPEVIVCLDSHIDDQMGADGSVESMPKNVQFAAQRATAHTWIRRATGDLPILLKAQGRDDEIDWLAPMYLVIPQEMINTHIMTRLEILKEHPEKERVIHPTFLENKNSYLRYSSEIMGFNIIASPPQNLLKLVDKLRTDFSILDIDVDYMYEMQNECYTPVKNARPGDLGWMEHVVKLIKKTKPKLITISEAKVAAIKNPTSNYSKFISRLKSIGYGIQYDQVFSNDKEAEDAIASYQGFFEKVQLPLMKKNASVGFDDPLHNDELLESAKNYFQT